MAHVDLLEALPGCKNATAVDLSTTDATLNPVCRRLYVGTTGDVKVDTVGGQTGVIFKNVPVGYLDVRASKVYRSGTTASNIVALS